MEPVLEIVGRTVIVYLWIYLLIRMPGKRQFGELNVLDVVTILALSNSVQNAMTAGLGDLWVGPVAVGTLVLTATLLARILRLSPAVRRQVTGNPVVLAWKGRYLDERMTRFGVTRGEVMQALRRQGLSSLARSRLVVLEADGSITAVS